MDEDLITNPRWSQRRQNRATAFRFIFQWEMNPTDDLNRDLNDFIHRLGKSDDYFSYAIELVDGIIEKKEIIDSMSRSAATGPFPFPTKYASSALKRCTPKRSSSA